MEIVTCDYMLHKTAHEDLLARADRAEDRDA